MAGSSTAQRAPPGGADGVGTSRLLGNAATNPIVQNEQSDFGGTGIVYTF